MTRLVIALLLCLASTASAHDFRPGVLALVERSPGELAMRFMPPIDTRGEVTEVSIVWPEGCSATPTQVRCEGGLAGALSVRGLVAGMKLFVTLERGAAREEWILDASRPRVTIDAAPRGTGLPWIRVGAEHIFGGLDHLAFVVGLLLVLEVALSRRLLLTITAFTIAHSTTLVLAVLGLLAVPSAPVEACIALSVVLVAREAMHDEPTLIRRYPWLAAGLFGLVHGLGFASALGALELPAGALAWTLLWFNVGVELGQLAVVVALLALVAVGRRLVGERRVVGVRLHRIAAYALGGLAAWWLLDRVLELARA